MNKKQHGEKVFLKLCIIIVADSYNSAKVDAANM